MPSNDSPDNSEAGYLAHYNPNDYPAPLVTVDLCIFTLLDDALKVLMMQRSDHPHKSQWALPGGFVDIRRDSTLQDAALRKLQEKTGVSAPYLEQLATVGDHQRDPRGWSLTVVYFALIPPVELPAAQSDQLRWVAADAPGPLAFDHQQLLLQALERLRSKVLYTLMPAHLIPAPFTLPTLQRAYESILGRSLEKKAFRRRLEQAGVLETTDETDHASGGRPAARYRLKPACASFSFNRQLNP